MKRISTVTLTAALVMTACSGDGESQATPIDEGITRSVASPEVTTTTTAAPATTTTTVLAPSTLAFSSSDDVGRLFALGSEAGALTAAGGDTVANQVAAGTIVQSSSLRSRDDVMWVRIESTVEDGPTLGWVRAEVLEPTLESVLYTDPASAREFRQVSGSVSNDLLDVFANPGAGSPIATLAADQIAMHGGVTALSPSGDFWRDVIDFESGTRLGWVEARFFNRVSGGELQDSNGNSVGRSPIEGVGYGQDIVLGTSTRGCNAVQLTFTNSGSSAGIGVVFGTSSPVGRELSSGRFDWSGTAAFTQAGVDLVITIPTADAQSWFFAPLDADGNASSSSSNDEGNAVADGVVQIEVPGTSCAPVAPASTAGSTDSGPAELDAYILSLPPAERDVEIARFEAEQAGEAAAEAEAEAAAAAEAEAAEGSEEAADGESSDDVAGEGEAPAGETPAETAPVDPAATEAAPAETASAEGQ